MMKHYFGYLEKQIKARWNKPMLSDFKSVTYEGKAIAEHITRLHILFQKSNLSIKDKVSLYGGNSSHWAIAFLATNTYNAVAVPILSEFCTKDASSLVYHSESRVLFTHRNIWAHMDCKDMPGLHTVISLDDFSVIWTIEGESETLGRSAVREYLSKYPDGILPGDIHFDFDFDFGSGNDLAAINYTSGTTSSPKGVMLTYDNFTTNVNFALEHIPPQEGDEIVSMLPMAHMYGFMFEFLYPLCGGVHIHFLGKTPTSAVLAEAFRDVKPFLLITVPLVMEKIFRKSVLPLVSGPALRILLSLPVISEVVLSTIRRRMIRAFGGNVREIVIGGAALNPEVEKWFKRIQLPYTVGYGMTEASPLLAYEDWKEYIPGSCGKVADRCEVRIDSNDPCCVAGEIQARGTNIMKGYFKNEKATSECFTDDGWFRTGDLGIMDKSGNIFIRGRSKNMILSSNGQNIYPEEIESIINSMPYIQESVVVSRGTGLTALVYAGGKDFILSREQYKDFISSCMRKINSRLPAYSKIRSIEMVAVPFEKTPKQSIKRFLYK